MNAQPQRSETLRETLTRLETLQEERHKEVMRRLSELPTKAQCAAEAGRLTAVENRLDKEVAPQISTLFSMHTWNLRTAIVTLITALIAAIKAFKP